MLTLGWALSEEIRAILELPRSDKGSDRTGKAGKDIAKLLYPELEVGKYLDEDDLNYIHARLNGEKVRVRTDKEAIKRGNLMDETHVWRLPERLELPRDFTYYIFIALGDPGFAIKVERGIIEKIEHEKHYIEGGPRGGPYNYSEGHLSSWGYFIDFEDFKGYEHERKEYMLWPSNSRVYERNGG